MKKGKKGILVLGIIIMGGLLIMACATRPGPQPVVPAEQAQCIPEWEVNPPSAEDGLRQWTCQNANGVAFQENG